MSQPQSAEAILEDISRIVGWDVMTERDLLLEYIENQGSNEAFFDFLHAKAEQDLLNGG